MLDKKIKETGMEADDLSTSQRRKRNAIIAAALEIFDRDGFEAARMIDIARGADVAKGTLYLYFETKEDLLEGMISAIVLPVVAELRSVAADTKFESSREKLHAQLKIVARQLSEHTMRKILRLMIANGPKRKRLSQFYYNQIVGPNVAAMEATVEAGIASGEFHARARYLSGSILAAPFVMGAVWKILFEPYEHLDADRLLEDMTRIVDVVLQPS